MIRNCAEKTVNMIRFWGFTLRITCGMILANRQKTGRHEAGRAVTRHRTTGAILGTVMVFVIGFGLAFYFVFAAVQGDYGLFRRVQIEADGAALKHQLAQLRQERAILENKTRRLSDTYLDLDLLDERARKVLGMARGDEIIIR